MAKFHTIDDLPALKGRAAGTRVLLRGDLNVPMKDGKVTDATRIERLAPTILALAAKGCRVALLSHFGRPDHLPFRYDHLCCWPMVPDRPGHCPEGVADGCDLDQMTASAGDWPARHHWECSGTWRIWHDHHFRQFSLPQSH